MTKLDGNADAKALDEDEKLIGARETNKESEEKPEKSGKALFSVLRAKKKKEGKFDENETIDCISKVIGTYGPWQRKFLIYYMFLYLISPFHNYGIIFFKAESDFWCADLAQVNILKSIR